MARIVERVGPRTPLTNRRGSEGPPGHVTQELRNIVVGLRFDAFFVSRRRVAALAGCASCTPRVFLRQDRSLRGTTCFPKGLSPPLGAYPYRATSPHAKVFCVQLQRWAGQGRLLGRCSFLDTRLTPLVVGSLTLRC